MQPYDMTFDELLESLRNLSTETSISVDDLLKLETVAQWLSTEKLAQISQWMDRKNLAIDNPLSPAEVERFMDEFVALPNDEAFPAFLDRLPAGIFLVSSLFQLQFASYAYRGITFQEVVLWLEEDGIPERVEKIQQDGLYPQLGVIVVKDGLEMSMRPMVISLPSILRRE